MKINPPLELDDAYSIAEEIRGALGSDVKILIYRDERHWRDEENLASERDAPSIGWYIGGTLRLILDDPKRSSFPGGLHKKERLIAVGAHEIGHHEIHPGDTITAYVYGRVYGFHGGKGGKWPPKDPEKFYKANRKWLEKADGAYTDMIVNMALAGDPRLGDLGTSFVEGMLDLYQLAKRTIPVAPGLTTGKAFANHQYLTSMNYFYHTDRKRFWANLDPKYTKLVKLLEVLAIPPSLGNVSELDTWYMNNVKALDMLAGKKG